MTYFPKDNSLTNFVPLGPSVAKANAFFAYYEQNWLERCP